MDNQGNHQDPFAGGIDIESSDRTGNANEQAAPLLTLEEINKLTGRNYKDVDTARKGLTDTFKYVGKAGKIESENKELKELVEQKDKVLGSELSQMREALFYTQNPQYESHKDIISSMGSDPRKVVESEAFKKVFEAVSAAEQAKKSKSVLETNPRIGEAKTKIDEAKTLVKNGRYSEASEAAVQAVIESMNLGQ